MANRRFPVLFPRILAFLAIAIGAGFVTSLPAEEPTTDSVFAEAPFDKWAAQGNHQEVPWQVQTSADRLSFHQRLIATIQVQVPVPELLKRSHDEHITLLVEVRNGQGVSSRNFGVLDLSDLKPEMKRSDVEFSWQAFAVPGQYELSVALWDKKSGEHNFLRRLFHVDAYRNDPLPEMWRGLDAFEFWGTKRDGPDYMFHADIEGRPNLALATRRPIDMEVLLDMTPSAEVFRGSYGYYNHYLGAALPTFKLLNQINLKNGSRSATALDLVQRHVVFEQNDGKDLDWASFAQDPFTRQRAGNGERKRPEKPAAEPSLSAGRNCATAESRVRACRETRGEAVEGVCAARESDGFLYISQTAGN